MKYCVHCHTLLTDSERVCYKCGVPTDAVICKDCWHYVHYENGRLVTLPQINDNDWKFCPNCGTGTFLEVTTCEKCGTTLPVIEGCPDCSGYSHYNPSQLQYTQPSRSYSSSSSYYDDSYSYSGRSSYSSGYVSGGTKFFVKLLLALTILTFIFSSVAIFGLSSVLKKEIIAEISSNLPQSPELMELVQQLGPDGLEKIVNGVFIFYGIFTLLPLCWIIPMRKKIVRAMRDGDTLSAGFKICTLIFVNPLVGIILLCSSNI